MSSFHDGVRELAFSFCFFFFLCCFFSVCFLILFNFVVFLVKKIKIVRTWEVKAREPQIERGLKESNC